MTSPVGAVRIFEAGPSPDGWALVVHGGAGARITELSEQARRAHAGGLTGAYRAGAALLAAGGDALDAVCAAVRVLEDDPLFNAGRGAVLTDAGTAELDACVMTGDGRAGAVTVCRFARNPVFAARHVWQENRAVLLADPSEERLAGWGLETVSPEHFVTAERQAQWRAARTDAARDSAAGDGAAPDGAVPDGAAGSGVAGGSSHGSFGTVGAVALDAAGHLAAATSTGGRDGQAVGRVGDTPIVGAGTYARDGLAAVSGTGEGEAFMRGVVAYDVAARIRYLGVSLADAVRATIEQELTARQASGGLIAVAADGSAVVAHNSPAMFAAFHDGAQLVIRT
ncbi:MAG: isoaspartyl peptidase/L-asparaginase [Actinomycetia bacterium]|nr:isoaspartyl peptidase/L-asparaginase [Actinomycetes bacterium]